MFRMQHATAVLASTAAAALVATTLASGASATPQDRTAPRPAATKQVVRFIDRVDPGSNTDLDLGRRGLSAGDQQLFTDRLVRDGRRVGTTVGVATISAVTAETIAVQVASTAILDKGSLTLAFAFVEVLAEGPDRVSLAAVTGGTGAYAGASGQCRSELLADGDDRAVTCRITVP